MKHYYITTELPIICTDEKKVYENVSIFLTKDNIKHNYSGPSYGDFVIIAGLPNQPTIDYSALSDEDCKVIGLINERYFTEIFYDLCKSSYPTMDNWAESIEYEKFKTSQSLNDKKWSDNDVKCAMYAIYDETIRKLHRDINCDKFIDNHIKLLNKLKVFEIEAIVKDNKVKILKVL